MTQASGRLLSHFFSGFWQTRATGDEEASLQKQGLLVA
jgi:hypothetical protein